MLKELEHFITTAKSYDCFSDDQKFSISQGLQNWLHLFITFEIFHQIWWVTPYFNAENVLICLQKKLGNLVKSSESYDHLRETTQISNFSQKMAKNDIFSHFL